MNRAEAAARLILENGELLLYPGEPAHLGDGARIEWVEDEPGGLNGAFWLRAGTVGEITLNGQPTGGEGSALVSGDRISISGQVVIFELLPLLPKTAPLTLPARLERPGVFGAAGGPRLVVVAGPDTGQEYPLWGEQVTIGRASRDATWEIRLSDRSVSRPHACIEKDRQGYQVRDLDSANGTQVNGSPVKGQPAPVRDGDVIGVGETRLVFWAK